MAAAVCTASLPAAAGATQQQDHPSSVASGTVPCAVTHFIAPSVYAPTAAAASATID